MIATKEKPAKEIAASCLRQALVLRQEAVQLEVLAVTLTEDPKKEGLTEKEKKRRLTMLAR